MRNIREIILLSLAVAVLIGCGKKADEDEGGSGDADSISQISAEGAQEQQADGGDAQAAAEDISISYVAAKWDSGEKDAAIAKFLSIDWQDGSVLVQIPGLSMSESDLISLSENDRNSVVQETMDLLSSMRKLFFHIASEAERLAGSGDKPKAEEYLGAIRNYGSSLAGQDHLQVVQMHGKAATAYAEKKLSELQ
ncbi:MAG: hypothetical protein RQ760_13460 [Sedimentisphaerales bacterium]|nr:hypothetical protein [Sedimentisphaerales bacterium]